MKIDSKISPQILAGVVGLLQPYCPDITVNKLLEKLQAEEKTSVKKIMTIAEFAEEKRVSKMTVLRMIRRGELSAERISKRCVRITI